jgi:hypothetical protein
MEEGASGLTKILEFDLEIKPTKLVKGQGLARLLVESNCKYLGVNFINTFSENQQAELSDIGPQVSPPLAECAWYKDIIFFLQKLHLLMVWKEQGKRFKAQIN